MDRMSRDQIESLKREWMDGGCHVLEDDDDKTDLEEVNNWIINFLDQDAMNDKDGYVVSRIYHSLNFDIPFAATKQIRDELIHVVRMKMKEQG
ncbi:hypothetical protein JHL17_33220 [Azospirillum sp. YIM B02556]|uniref:CdiI immunity protein domain-containing protein n=1 Tax=Azospirillum endophyticum TaxID=2800326 RepID=A0ABS1FFT1_9PROT|nr:hypothetical protein [Azospirillum endophyticum]MBK1842269.1 hypothetical protein [Azospirillum endophyticum]